MTRRPGPAPIRTGASRPAPAPASSLGAPDGDGTNSNPDRPATTHPRRSALHATSVQPWPGSPGQDRTGEIGPAAAAASPITEKPMMPHRRGRALKKGIRRRSAKRALAVVETSLDALPSVHRAPNPATSTPWRHCRSLERDRHGDKNSQPDQTPLHMKPLSRLPGHLVFSKAIDSEKTRSSRRGEQQLYARKTAPLRTRLRNSTTETPSSLRMNRRKVSALR